MITEQQNRTKNNHNNKKTNKQITLGLVLRSFQNPRRMTTIHFLEDVVPEGRGNNREGTIQSYKITIEGALSAPILSKCVEWVKTIVD